LINHVRRHALAEGPLVGVVATGAIYFAAVFAAGFCLGVLRTLLVQPLLGPLSAVALELPIILGIAWLACTRILGRHPLTRGGAGIMGALAFALLMLGELMVSTLLGGRSWSGHLALYAQAQHQLGLAGQLVYALFPVIQVQQAMHARRAREGRSAGR